MGARSVLSCVSVSGHSPTTRSAVEWRLPAVQLGTDAPSQTAHRTPLTLAPAPMATGLVRAAPVARDARARPRADARGRAPRVGRPSRARSVDRRSDARRWATATAAAELHGPRARHRDAPPGRGRRPALGAPARRGRAAQSERQVADRLIAALEEADGAVVRAVCLATDGGRVTRLAGATGSRRRGLRLADARVTRATRSSPAASRDRPQRAADRARAGSCSRPTLVRGSRRDAGVLAVEIGLDELFETTPATSAGASARAARGLPSIERDRRRLRRARPSSPAPRRSGDSRPLGNLRIRRRRHPRGPSGHGARPRGGRLGRDRRPALAVERRRAPRARPDLAGAGRRLVRPRSASRSSAFAIGVLVVAVVVARTFLRPFDSLAESQAQLEVLYREAREDSLHDGLTGLGNHRSFQEELDRQLDLFRRHQVPVALLLIDLDDLKVVNDGEGHAAGDQLLARDGELDPRHAPLRRPRLPHRRRRVRDHPAAHRRTVRADRRQPAAPLLPRGPRPGERADPVLGRHLVGADAGDGPRRALPPGRRRAVLLQAPRTAARSRSSTPTATRCSTTRPSEGAAIAIRDIIRTRSLHAGLPAHRRPAHRRRARLRGPHPSGPGHRRSPTPASSSRPPPRRAARSSSTSPASRSWPPAPREIDRQQVVSINLSPRTLEVPDFSASWLLETLARNAISPGPRHRRADRARGHRRTSTGCAATSRCSSMPASASRPTTSAPATRGCACSRRSASTS